MNEKLCDTLSDLLLAANESDQEGHKPANIVDAPFVWQCMREAPLGLCACRK